MRPRRVAPSVSILIAIMLMTLWPALLTSADSASDTGSVTVEIVPPGTLPTTPVPVQPVQPPQPAAGAPSVREIPPTPKTPSGHGTLSATLMWLPDPDQGTTTMHGLIAVQDHRAQASGWTVRLQGNDVQPAYLVTVEVGGAGFGIPEWLYAGIFAWDVAVGSSLVESPQLVTAPRGNGYSLTIHQVWIDVDPIALGTTGSLHTLVLILPFAP